MSDRHAWATGVEEVTPTVHRIPLSLPTDGLRAVNVYAVSGPDGVGLIDGGWSRDGALTELERGLREIGHELGEVTSVLATHFHPDHYTLAVDLHRLTGCPISLGAGEEQTVQLIVDGEHGMASFSAMLVRSGVPEDYVRHHLEETANPDHYEAPTTWLRDGDRPRLGDREVEAVSTPGHTRGHFCFADEPHGLLFAGDHVLPHITPAIGFESVQDQHLPLADFLASLARLKARPDALLLPAHGPVTSSVHARADELTAHHEERLDRCLDALASGCRTSYDVARTITWTRHERPISELTPLDQLMAVHETRAHLEVLVADGRAQSESSPELDEYVAG